MFWENDLGRSARVNRELYAKCAASILIVIAVCFLFVSGVHGEYSPLIPPAPAGTVEMPKTGIANSNNTAAGVESSNCSTIGYAGNPYYQFRLPQTDAAAVSMRFSPDDTLQGDTLTVDSLRAVKLFVFNPGNGSFGNDIIYVKIYSDNGGLPGTLLLTVPIPPGSYVAYPDTTIIDVSSYNLAFNHDFHIGISTSGSVDYESFVCDDGTTGTGRSCYFDQGQWHRFADGTGRDYNFLIWVTLCQPICYATGDINGNGTPLEIADLLFLIRYIYNFGAEPVSPFDCDLDGDYIIDTQDIAKFRCYLYQGMSCFPTYPVPTSCAPEASPFTVGMHHNRALDYLSAHSPLSGSEYRLTRSDIYNILDSTADYCTSMGFDVAIAKESFRQMLDSMTMFYTEGSETYFGVPSVTDSALSYLTTYFCERGEMSNSLRTGLHTLNQKLISETSDSALLNYVGSILPTYHETPQESLIVLAASDVFLHSYAYNTPLMREVSPEGKRVRKIAAEDLKGAMVGGLSSMNWLGALIGAAVYSGIEILSPSSVCVVRPVDSLSHKGITHHAFQGTSLNVALGNLEVRPLTTGTCGFWLELNAGNGWGSHWYGLDPESILSDSSCLSVGAVGQVGGIPDQAMWTSRAQKIGSVWQVSTDFSPLAAVNQIVRVFNGDELVDSVVTAAGVCVNTPGPDDVHLPPGCPGPTFPDPTVKWTYDFPGPISLPGRLQPVVGDAVVISPLGYSAVPGFVSRVEFRNERVRAIVFDSEVITNPFPCGDANGDGGVDISDAVYLIAYIFSGGPAPNPLEAGDANSDGAVDISDAVYLIAYIFSGGPAPCEGRLGRLDPATGEVGVNVSPAETVTENAAALQVQIDSKADIAGLQLEFTGDVDNADDIMVTTSERSRNLQLFSGVDGDLFKVGLVDLQGQNAITAGSGSVINIEFKNQAKDLELLHAIACDRAGQKLSVTIGAVEKVPTLPKQFSLSQNYPNPFNPTTEIRFALPKSCEARVEVLNVLGQTVKTLATGMQTAGTHQVIWDGTDERGNSVSSGVYFYRLVSDEFSTSRKMLLLK